MDLYQILGSGFDTESLKNYIEKFISRIFSVSNFYTSERAKEKILHMEKLNPEKSHISRLMFYIFIRNHLVENPVKNEDFIFVGGFGRSGTTLMRAILDVHPNIRCGPETKIIPSILQWHRQFTGSKGIMKQIKDAEIISENGKLAERLCDKDPNVAKFILYLKYIFPKSKFILMIRDPRAIVYSYSKIYRKSNDSNFLEKTAKSWNNFMKNALEECKMAGDEYCLKVYYEKLVKNPDNEIKNVINFIGERWHNSLLNHEKYIGDEIVVSKSEWSTGQIKNKIHTKSISLWKKNLPKNFIKNFKTYAPMLSLLRYDNETCFENFIFEIICYYKFLDFVPKLNSSKN
ncbi:hypothetical protein BpHYR1_031511 [Brachionus plicatilis]|uniref:Protein-tyrosine sulfotransferase n=1 Tax=Brachionus plicatilis TaxID=10195 RepID=A0A3M7T1U5_BRAPC|nr:hypothetical protein BpHYR1_031511 [Brachionus plicatilis]